jgi:predicted ATPase
VLGREFAHELIEPVAQRDEMELQAALGQLSDARLLFCRGTAPHSSYAFKHALAQDAAYDMLLRGRRQELHARLQRRWSRISPISSSASQNSWPII